MRTIMSECVGDAEGVETGELEGKEMEGKKNRCKNRNRQIEGGRAAETGREGWVVGCLLWTDSGSPGRAGFEKMKEVKH